MTWCVLLDGDSDQPGRGVADTAKNPQITAIPRGLSSRTRQVGRAGHPGFQIFPGGNDKVVVARPTKHRYNAPCLSYADSTRGIVADLTRGWVKGQGQDRVRGVQCLYESRFADTISVQRLTSCP
jgi:hypothetical protein